MSEVLPGSHKQILKSSALIGGSAVVNVLIGLVKTKFTAIYLGTAGVGLMGMYSGIIGMGSTLAGLGVNSSGVRQIAEAVGTGDQVRIARTILTLRRAVLVLALLGALVLVGVARPVSMLTFGDTTHTVPVMILSVVILFAAISGGQTALVQGYRRISDLARLRVVGALRGTLVAIPLMILWGQKSVVPILVSSAAMAILTSWYYARKIEVCDVTMSWRETWQEARPLVRLGCVFASSALMSTGVAYLSRVIVVRRLGLDAAGLYGAAWSLSSFYVGFILGAMGADFYPRLTAAAKNNAKVNQMVNEQTEVSLLLALPGLVGTMTFAPWVIHLLYSSAFVPAGEVFRWQVLGLVLRVLSWPMGFIILAKGEAKIFFWCEFAASLVNLGLTWGGVVFWGLKGAGIAFFGLYVFQSVLMFIVSRRLTGFRWSPFSVKLITLVAVVSTAVFLSAIFLPRRWDLSIGAMVAVGAAVYSLVMLKRLTGTNPLDSAILKLKNGLKKYRMVSND